MKNVSKMALSVDEASEYTGIGRNTLRQLVDWKMIPVLRVGRKILLKTDVLSKFIDLNEGRNLRVKTDVVAYENECRN